MTSYSAVGRDALALAAFDRAKRLSPESADVRAYLGLHLARGARWIDAIPLLERAEAEFSDRLPVLEALARLREREHRPADAIGLWSRIHALRAPRPGERARVGLLAMDAEKTPLALQAFEDERAREPAAFTNNLELGVLYLSARRFEDARDALDRVSPRHPAYPMALFKRAQVSVLLKEPDQTARIETAKRHADAVTRPLIERERLFQATRGQ